MKTQKEVEEKLTLEIIKKMVELAEGFEIHKDPDYITAPYKTIAVWAIKNTLIDFPLLIHRTVEGFNKKHIGRNISVNHFAVWYIDEVDNDSRYDFFDYQSATLTACECAILDCLIEVLK